MAHLLYCSVSMFPADMLLLYTTCPALSSRHTEDNDMVVKKVKHAAAKEHFFSGLGGDQTRVQRRVKT